ncbi:MAG: Rho termination factor N-terminal domain-containing protein [Desulfovibrionales bacterium]|nr:Rho termination factor N-terminal domain-containing protein [Desulfovibrionales bacterium]
MGKKEKEKKEKTLESMTVKELREIALQIPDIVGVHGMNKDEVIAAIKKARGITDEPKKKPAATMREVKAKAKELRAKLVAAHESGDKKKACINRRRISRLKKKTRRAG